MRNLSHRAMHDIEPYHKWRDYYIASEDKQSPLYGRSYSEFEYSHKIYNYYIHPQWDDFGSQSMYLKVLFVDYEDGVACIELIGEWNDCLHNDIMFFKREIVDKMLRCEITKFIVFCDNVLVFHGDEDDYYEEWYQDVSDEGGWVTFVNIQEHVMKEMEQSKLQYYVNMGPEYNNISWRRDTPDLSISLIKMLLNKSTKQLRY